MIPRLFPDLIKSSKARGVPEKILCCGENEKGSCGGRNQLAGSPELYTKHRSSSRSIAVWRSAVLCTPHLLMCSPPSLHSGEEMRYRPHTAHCPLPLTLYTPHCAPHCTLHTAYCTLHTAHCTLHTAHCTLQTAQRTLHNAHCTTHNAHYTMHTALHCAVTIALIINTVFHCTVLLSNVFHFSVGRFIVFYCTVSRRNILYRSFRASLPVHYPYFVSPPSFIINQSVTPVLRECLI